MGLCRLMHQRSGARVAAVGAVPQGRCSGSAHCSWRDWQGWRFGRVRVLLGRPWLRPASRPEVGVYCVGMFGGGLQIANGAPTKGVPGDGRGPPLLSCRSRDCR